jgi:catechol 2,3-dioxygenase-like lactoylglutathione lyase family enzyme
MAVKRIVPDLPLRDADASYRFYSEVLGLELGMDLGWVMNFGSPDSHPIQINLIQGDATAPVDPDVTIEVTEVDRVYATCLDYGVPIIYPLTNEPWGVRRFFARDPNGAVLNIMSHLPGEA